VRQQSKQLCGAGMMVFPESPARRWRIILGCVAFTVLSVGLLVLANQSDSLFQVMLGVIAGVVFFGFIGIPAMARRIVHRSRLVVAPEGVRRER